MTEFGEEYMKEETKCCDRDFDSDGNCDKHPCCKDSAYDPEDVTTWSQQQFDSKVTDKLKLYWNRMESIKLLMRDGKVWVAGEQLQGLGDSFGFLIQLFETRMKSCQKSGCNKSQQS